MYISNCCDDKNVNLKNLVGNEFTSSMNGFEFEFALELNFELNSELNWNLFILRSVIEFELPDMLEVVL